MLQLLFDSIVLLLAKFYGIDWHIALHQIVPSSKSILRVEVDGVELLCLGVYYVQVEEINFGFIFSSGTV